MSSGHATMHRPVVRPPETTVSAGDREGRLPVVLGVIAAILYSAWVAAGFLDPHLDPVTSFVSELTADGRPNARLFRVTEVCAGLAFMATGALLVRRRRRLGWQVAGPSVLLVAFGLFTLLDAMAPLACAPTVDAACRSAELAGEVPLRHTAHSVTSSLAGGVAALAVAWLWWTRRDGGRWHVATTALGVVHLLAAGWSLIEVAEWGIGFMGLTQRLSLLALAAWWVLFVSTSGAATPQPREEEQLRRSR